jgi:hypothetical protein
METQGVTSKRKTLKEKQPNLLGIPSKSRKEVFLGGKTTLEMGSFFFASASSL